MLLAKTCQVPLGLVLALCVLSSDARPGRLHKRDNYVDVLGGANFPDPSILDVGGTSYVFGTVDGAGHNVPQTSNPDFNNPSSWSAITDAFPPTDVPAMGSNGWAAPMTTWGPDVNQLTDYDGSFAMYYSAALQSDGGIHCVGLARSGVVTGPYNDSSTEPMICPESAGGAIDPAGFLDDDNNRYVVYKIDGPAINNGGYCNSPNNPPSTNTSLMLQQVDNNGYTTIGGPAVLYNNQGVSDSYNVEAPTIVKNDGVYFLFFSSGCTSADSYTVSYVTSTSGSIWGPYGDRQMLLQTGDYGEYGPGGADVTPTGGQMVYHSEEASDDDAVRWLNTADIVFSGQTVSIS